MLIVIEGPDLAGKSTLAARLAARLLLRDDVSEVESRHAGPPRLHPLDEYVTPLLGYRPGRGTAVVCDRWHWGERVYPTVLGRPTEMTSAVWLYTELFLRSRGAFALHVTAPESTLRARHAARGDDLVAAGQLTEIRKRFFTTAGTSMLPNVTCDEPGRDHDIELRDLVDLARKSARLPRNLSGFVTYVGPPDPDVLLLGDVRGGDPVTHGLRPAFEPRPASSGHYLLRALTGVYDAGRVGIANACDVDDPVALWRALRHPAVVTLGGSAHARMTTVPHGAVTHPQHWRRFFSGYVDEYAALIERAADTGEDLRSWRPPGSWADERTETRDGAVPTRPA